MNGKLPKTHSFTHSSCGSVFDAVAVAAQKNPNNDDDKNPSSAQCDSGTLLNDTIQIVPTSREKPFERKRNDGTKEKKKNCEETKFREK